MVLSAREDRLKARTAVAEIDPLDQPHAVQEVERPVDAGQADGGAFLAQTVGDLLCGQAAALAGEKLDDRPPGSAGPVTGFAKRPAGALGPVRRRLAPACHEPHDSAVMRPILSKARCTSPSDPAMLPRDA
jgi:hypothetical protein